MILAKVRVTARDVDSNELLAERRVYLAATKKDQLVPAAIRKFCDQMPELNSASVRFEVVTENCLALTKENASAVLVEFLTGYYVLADGDNLLDKPVHKTAESLASAANNEGLQEQLVFLLENLSLEELVDTLIEALDEREEAYAPERSKT